MHEADYYTKIENKGPSKKSMVLMILFFLILVLIPIFIFQIKNHSSQKNADQLLNPLAKTVEKTISIIFDENSKQIENIVQKTLKDDKDFGIVIKNLKTKERYYFNEHKIFESASLYKLWIMAETYRQIEEGKLTENNILTADMSILNIKYNVSTDSAKLEEMIITWPVQNALELMIIISDNDSALLLTDKIRLTNVSAFLRENGFEESAIGTKDKGPITTALDTAEFFEKLYLGELSNQMSTDKMINLLKQQKLNSKIPKYLPKDLVIAHKTGELNGLSHDGGIVYEKNGDFVIVFLSETQSPSLANEKIAEISKNVYNYFLNNN